MNQEEGVISEFEMDFKKSRFSSSLNAIPGLKMGMDLRDGSETGVVNNIFFSVKQGQDFKNLAAYAHQKFPGIPPHPPGYLGTAMGTKMAVAFANI